MGNTYVCGQNPNFSSFIILMYYANRSVCIATGYELEGQSSISFRGKHYLYSTM
jgi:hypothetical protein